MYKNFDRNIQINGLSLIASLFIQHRMYFRLKTDSFHSASNLFSTENFDRNNPIETGSLRKFFVKQSVHSSKNQVTLIAIPLYAM